MELGILVDNKQLFAKCKLMNNYAPIREVLKNTKSDRRNYRSISSFAEFYSSAEEIERKTYR